MILSALIFSLVFTLFQPLEYRAETRLLIIYKQNAGFDPYLAIKAAERLSQTFSEVIFTSSFINKVQTSTYIFPPDFFATDPLRLKKQWKKMVAVSGNDQSGTLKIQVYHTDKALALKLATAIARVLVTQGSEYHGSGNDVAIKILDIPFSSNEPVRPNILLNIGLAFFGGCVISSLWLFLTMDEPQIMFSRRYVLKTWMSQKQLDNESQPMTQLKKIAVRADIPQTQHRIRLFNRFDKDKKQG